MQVDKHKRYTLGQGLAAKSTSLTRSFFHFEVYELRVLATEESVPGECGVFLKFALYEDLVLAAGVISRLAEHGFASSWSIALVQFRLSIPPGRIALDGADLGGCMLDGDVQSLVCEFVLNLHPIIAVSGVQSSDEEGYMAFRPTMPLETGGVALVPFTGVQSGVRIGAAESCMVQTSYPKRLASPVATSEFEP